MFKLLCYCICCSRDACRIKKSYTIGLQARVDTRIDACSVFRTDFRSSYIMNSTIAGIEVCVLLKCLILWLHLAELQFTYHNMLYSIVC